MRIKDCATVADLLGRLGKVGSPIPAEPLSEIVQKVFEFGIPMVKLADAVQVSEATMNRYRSGQVVPADIIMQTVVDAIRNILTLEYA
jgi:hypothetical protein